MELEQLIDTVREYFSDPNLHPGVVIGVSLVAAFVIEWFVRRTLMVLASKTETELDDKIIDALRRPIIITVIIVGFSWSAALGSMDFVWLDRLNALLETVGVFVWSVGLIKVGSAILETVSAKATPGSLVQVRTVPVFDFLLKVTVISMAGYSLLLFWEIDITAWLASAGIAGVAVGFAARDSLANLFAGIFILADGPYKIGDFIVLDDGMRGVVTNIGIRSTRILTRDDVEVIIPNALMGTHKIVNQTGGPNPRCRVTAKVSVAYGSDIDVVKEILLGCVEDVAHVVKHPKPVVHFKAFGDSGLEFSLYCWIIRPVFLEQTQSTLLFKIYKALGEVDIEIPYSKHDVYIKEMPKA